MKWRANSDLFKIFYTPYRVEKTSCQVYSDILMILTIVQKQQTATKINSLVPKQLKVLHDTK